MTENISLDLDSTFSSRFDKLRRGAIRIAYYYDYPDESTFRYRVYNMIEALDTSQQILGRATAISASWFCFRDAQMLNSVVDNCDIIIMVRARYSGPVANAICRAKIKGRKIYYDIDDLVVDVNLIPMIVSALDQDMENDKIWEYWFQYVSRLKAVLIECDEVIATNAELGKNISKLYDKSFSVIPNFYNAAQESVSAHVRNAKLDAGKQESVFRIGYFSGSPSHNKDFEIASSSLLQMLDRYENSRLTIVGHLELSDKFSKYKNRIDRLPIMNFAPLQAEISKVDLNISPLQDNIFTRCKSELKFFEAALVMTPTLASRVGTFASSMTHNEDGWLAMPHDWSYFIDEIISIHSSDRDQLEGICRAALRTSQENFSYTVMDDKIRQVLLPG